MLDGVAQCPCARSLAFVIPRLGQEALALQGFVLTDLPTAASISHTDAQLHDLAGNAWLGLGSYSMDT